MHRPPRAILAPLVALSAIATAFPLNVPTSLAPAAASARSAKDSHSTILQQFATDGHAPAGPGVDHTWGRIVTGSGQQVVHLVTVQAGAPGITVEAGLSNDSATGLERTTTQANRKSAEGHRAIAAINGDSWSGFSGGSLAAPNGIDIQNGELLVAPSSSRPSFGIDGAGHPIIGAPAVTTNVILPDGSFHGIDHINQRRGPGEFTLFTPRFGGRTDSDPGGVAVVLSGVPLPLATTVNAPGTVVEVDPGEGGVAVSGGDVVVTGPATSWLASLVPGQQVTLTISITAEWQTVTQAIGARGYLVRNGATYISPHPGDADQPHPRTAVGIGADGSIILVAVDGRDSGYSTGVTDSELAALLEERGAVSALNLDGGGSTAMAVRQPGDTLVSIVNRPSDGSERPVANSLIVFSAAPTGPLATVTVSPNNQTVYTTRTVDFHVFGQDAAFNPVGFSASAVQWSVTGAQGTFDAAGRFTATAPGTATITATVNGISGSVRLNVRADTSPPSALPPLVQIVTGTTLGTTVPVNVGWDAGRDTGLGVAGYQLQQNINGKGWKVYPSGSALNRHAAPDPGLVRNANYRFSVRAADGAGNLSGWASGPSFRTVVLSEASSSLRFSSGWTRTSSPSYDGHAAKSARIAGASVTYSFVGSGFGWVSAKSPVRGLARVYVDGSLAAIVSTYAKDSIARRIVFAESWPGMGRHTIRIVVLGTPGHPRVDVDAFIVLASPTITSSAPPAGPAPTPAPTPTPTPTPGPTPRPSPSPKPTPGPTPSPSGSGSPSPAPSGSPVATATV